MTDEAYPHGKLNEEDEGELELRISTRGDVVVIDFGKPVKWIGLHPEHARGVAALLIKWADDLEKGTASDKTTSA